MRVCVIGWVLISWIITIGGPTLNVIIGKTGLGFELGSVKVGLKVSTESFP